MYYTASGIITPVGGRPMHKVREFIICLYMFRALCAYHQEAKLYSTASGIITLVSGRPMHKVREFIICLYMFRALCAYHQEVKIVFYSIWYHHTCRWPSGAQGERVYYKPVHVSSTMCLSSGGQNCIIQHLVPSHLSVAVRCAR